MENRLFLVIILLLAVLGTSYLLKRWQAMKGKESESYWQLKQGIPAIVYFWSPTCHACILNQKPVLETLVCGLGENNIQVIMVNIAEDLEVARKWRVMTVPTTFVLDKIGSLQYINNGIASVSKLTMQLESF